MESRTNEVVRLLVYAWNWGYIQCIQMRVCVCVRERHAEDGEQDDINFPVSVLEQRCVCRREKVYSMSDESNQRQCIWHVRQGTRTLSPVSGLTIAHRVIH